MIYHITPAGDWQKALEQGDYRADSLETEGFIHCSSGEQVIATANRYYRGVNGLVLLEIEVEKVVPEIRWENLVGGEELFPHIYGPLNLEAVRAVNGFEPGPDGQFKSTRGT